MTVLERRRRSVVGAAAVMFAVAAPIALTDTSQAAVLGGCTPAYYEKSDRVLRQAGVIRADIDGDGRADRVFIAERAHQPRRCRFILVVRTAKRAFVTTIRQPGADQSWPTFDAPKLESAAPIDRARGEEVVVAVNGGASITSLAVFSIHRGNLIRFGIPKGNEDPDTFASGGSLAGSFTVNCLARGLVVQSGLGMGPGRTFDVTRTIYRAEEDSFRFVSYRSYRHLTLRVTRARFSEFRRGASMFSACR